MAFPAQVFTKPMKARQQQHYVHIVVPSFTQSGQ
jgi:hypothetical protein